MSVFHTLKVSKVVRQTPDAVSIALEIPEGLSDEFKYVSGQYITFKVEVNGEKLNRSYSLCSSPCTGETHTIAVKEVKGGKVSNYIHDKVNVGDKIEVMPPDGRFILTPDPEKRRTYYFFGAGSGI